MVNLLEPCSTSIDGFEASPLPPGSKPFSVSFTGWRFANMKFTSWSTKMAALHKPIWRKAGIFEALTASTHTIYKDTDLVLSVAEKWCPNTNTFVFPWGEATITLEDVMVLLGFSVLGSPVFAALDNEGKKIKAKLVEERSNILKEKKLSYVTHVSWMERFEGCGDELEHVAFLVVWLCYFVFPSRYHHVYQDVFHIAVHLSRGTRIALAPAVLAHLYSDLSILKTHIRDFTKSKDANKISLSGLFKLVQVWTWERFRDLQPESNRLIKGETRLALWHDPRYRASRARRVLDNSNIHSFEWRPYTKPVENWEFPQFYPEKAMFVPVGPDLDDEFVSFARCYKVSELVGIGCVEHYFPNRVALQFGMHQDVPATIKRNNLSQKEAWTDYSKPIDDLTLYIPSRSATGCVTPMYKEWWRKSMSEENLVVEALKQRNIAYMRQKDLNDKRLTCMKRVCGDDESAMGRCQKHIENDEDTDAQVVRLGKNKYSNVKKSRENASEWLGETEKSINDSGPRIILAFTGADGDETIRSPEKEQRNEGTCETGRNLGNDKSMSPNDENHSSDPPLGFDEAIDTVVSPPETRKTCEDEFGVYGSNAEMMTMIDDGSKELEYLLHEDDAIAGEKASSCEKEDDAVGLIQRKLASKAHNNEPTPRQNLANRDHMSTPYKSTVLSSSDESNIHIAGGSETQGQDCSHHDNTLGSEETRNTDEQLENLEKRNEDVGNDSYRKSLLKLKDSYDESSHKLKRLESTIDELIIKAERNIACLKEQRAIRQGN